MILHGRAVASITLPDAVKAALPVLGGATALLFSAAECALARESKGVLTARGGAAIDLSAFYEARIFCEHAELRWVHGSGGAGRAVLLSAEAVEVDAFPDDASLDYVETLKQTYLVWGRRCDEQPADTWTALSAGRIGRLHVPAVVRETAQLRSLEYVVFDEDGNATVAEERLLGIFDTASEGV
jgi:CRISPR-associated protein (TIGR03984 family)